VSTNPVEIMPRSLLQEPLPMDRTRGSNAILQLIATEATLFGMMFATYWYLGKGKPHWPMDDPPKLHYAIPMLVILALSSGLLHWGEKQVKRENTGSGMVALAVVILMGLAFIVLTVMEDMEHLKTLTPTQDAYGSIFYATTTLHAAHLTLGLFMLSYIFLLPKIEPRREPPYRPYHNAALYWHFVDTVWLFVVIILYIIPNAFR